MYQIDQQQPSLLTCKRIDINSIPRMNERKARTHILLKMEAKRSKQYGK